MRREGGAACLRHEAERRREHLERRARQAELQASKRAEDDASSLQRAVAVASDLSQLLREAEAKEEASKKDVEALDHAAARLRARLEAAEKAAAAAKDRDADVRRRYCDTAELQAALASEKARTHRRLAGRVKALAAKGADVNEGDYDDRTALHLGAAEGRLDVVEFLVAHGAEVDRVDRWQGTPLRDAETGKHEKVVAFLTKNGATPSRRPVGAGRRASRPRSISFSRRAPAPVAPEPATPQGLVIHPPARGTPL